MNNSKSKEMQVVNGITVYGKKIQREKNILHPSPEDSSINFSSTDASNIGKIAVYLLRDEVFGRILAPNDGDDIDMFLHHGEILHEDEDSFIIKRREFLSGECTEFVMKHPERYSFFRIVDTEEEVEAIRALVENYAERLFEAVGGVWPFDIRMLEELGESVEEGCDPDAISIEEQEMVLAKLRKTRFEPFDLFRR